MIRAREIIQTMILNNRLNYILASFVLLAILSYVYCANVAVRTVTTLQNTKASSQDMRAEVTDLESKYLSMENSVNIRTASMLGLEESKEPIFLVKKDKVKSLSLR